MSETGQTTGSGPAGPWRHRPRPVRAVRIESGSRADQGYGESGGPQPPPEACPWLYLASEPNARAAYVTDAHRCELRQEVVPGPGHQLAYCMTANHISCPQLRAYEERRQAAAPISPGPAYSEAVPPVIEGAPVAAGAPAQAAGTRLQELGGWLGRGGSAALGALGAIVLLGALALLYASPGSTQTAGPVTAAPSQATAEAASAAVAATAPPFPTLAPSAATPSPEDAATPVPTPEPTIDATPVLATAMPTPGPAAEAPAGPVLVPYIVQPGDTLMVIAATYNADLDELLAANGLSFDSPIYHGQQLLLPIRVLAAR